MRGLGDTFKKFQPVQRFFFLNKKKWVKKSRARLLQTAFLKKKIGKVTKGLVGPKIVFSKRNLFDNLVIPQSSLSHLERWNHVILNFPETSVTSPLQSQLSIQISAKQWGTASRDLMTQLPQKTKYIVRPLEPLCRPPRDVCHRK